VTALERDGLARRRADPRDGRGTVIEPTELGLTQVDAVAQARRAVYDRLLHDWSAADRQQLADVLRHFNESAEAYVRASRS
jgi:DNA-binding MarR family transcriptional regulator